MLETCGWGRSNAVRPTTAICRVCTRQGHARKTVLAKNHVKMSKCLLKDIETYSDTFGKTQTILCAQVSRTKRVPSMAPEAPPPKKGKQWLL